MFWGARHDQFPIFFSSLSVTYTCIIDANTKQGWITLPSGNPGWSLNQYSNTGSTLLVLPVYALHQAPALWNGLCNTTWLPGIHCIYKHLWIQYVVHIIQDMVACLLYGEHAEPCTRNANNCFRELLARLRYQVKVLNVAFKKTIWKRRYFMNILYLCVFLHVCVRRKWIFIFIQGGTYIRIYRWLQAVG